MNSQVPYSNKNPSDIFVCQIPNAAEVEEWISGDTFDLKDPEQHWCAMCCVRMLLLAEDMPAPSLEDLFKEACRHGVYQQDEYIGWRGAYHKELASFINSYLPASKWLQRQASAHRGKKIRATSDNKFFNLEATIRSGCYALLSVHPDIRLDTDETPPNKRGHFVFVYGVQVCGDETFFLLNNPAGFQSNNSQIGARVSAKRLEQVSSGDCVLIKSRFSGLLCE